MDPDVHYYVHKRLTWDHVLSQLSPIHNLDYWKMLRARLLDRLLYTFKCLPYEVMALEKFL